MSARGSDVLVRGAQGKGLAVYAARWFAAGETAVVGRPTAIVPVRTRFSFQKDWQLHIDLDEPARLLNHSCEPNLGVVDNDYGGYDFVALRTIALDEELTWDYETTEYESIAVRRCLCQAPSCRQRTRGFKYRSRSDRVIAAGYVAGYLKRLARTEAVASPGAAIRVSE